MGDKRTMTLNLSTREMEAVERLSFQQELSKTAVIRQALRLYDLVNARIRAGETMSFSGDKERIAMFIGPGWDAEARQHDPAVQAQAFAALSPTNPQEHDDER